MEATLSGPGFARLTHRSGHFIEETQLPWKRSQSPGTDPLLGGSSARNAFDQRGPSRPGTTPSWAKEGTRRSALPAGPGVGLVSAPKRQHWLCSEGLVSTKPRSPRLSSSNHQTQTQTTPSSQPLFSCSWGTPLEHLPPTGGPKGLLQLREAKRQPFPDRITLVAFAIQ